MEEEEKTPEEDVELKRYKCEKCGNVLESEDEPDMCPRCGAGSEEFIELKD
ncbi:hypothetical protein GOV04_00330 [Candidatus Woesearchaeota archaeon]|nr:hypothetical protein [Candidatus Woesearchaeota archaeon]